MEIKYENVYVCDVCGSKNSKIIYENLNDYLSQKDGEFCLSECCGCGHAFLNKRPHEESIDYYYQDSYYTHSSSAFSNEKKFISSFKGLLISIIMFPHKIMHGKSVESFEPKSSGNLLDIGCGNGEFLYEMSKKNWNLYGNDTDEKALKVAKVLVPDSKLLAEKVTFDTYKKNNFEMVMLSHVLEHVYNPNELLSIVNNILESRGLLVIRVPNYHSLERRIFGKYWRGLEVPRHLNHFTPSSIRKLIEKSDFNIKHIRPQPLPMCLIESIYFALNNRFKLNISKSNIFYKFLYIVFYVPVHIFSFLSISSAMEIILEKK